MTQYKFKILKIEPGARESEDHIVDASVKFQVGDFTVWAFVPDWHKYFPYYPVQSKWGLGKKLIKNLEGKEITMNLSFFNFSNKTKKVSQEKKQVLPGKIV